MILQGIILMCAGMGTVFTFLVVMIGVMTLTSNLVRKFAPAPAPVVAKAPPAPVAQKVAAGPSQDMAKIAAVIAIARREYGLH